MMATTNDLIAFVREVTDLDQADLPSDLIVAYMKDGFQRIVNLERRWPFLETTATLNTVASQRDYPLSSIGSGDIREITSILDNSASGNRLQLVSLDDAEATWHGAFDTPARPLLFAEWNNSIKLYPKPDTVYPLIIRGYRKASYSWTTQRDTEVDCDERLHNAIAYYAVSQVYKRQEDNEMSSSYKASFDEAVTLARKELMRAPAYRQMIMARGVVRPSEKYWLESLGRNLGL
jgi:hypothetical protein